MMSKCQWVELDTNIRASFINVKPVLKTIATNKKGKFAFKSDFMTRIGLEGMEFHAFHGYYEAERKMGNKYLVDVFVHLKIDLKNSEDIQDTVNYEHIYDITKKEMSEAKQLLETVAYEIANKLKSGFSIIESVEVKLRKVGVQLGGKVEQSVIDYKI